MVILEEKNALPGDSEIVAMQHTKDNGYEKERETGTTRFHRRRGSISGIRNKVDRRQM